MRAVVLGVLLAAPALAQACPACASAQRSGPSAWHLVLVVLPFIVVGWAARAINAALRDDRIDETDLRIDASAGGEAHGGPAPDRNQIR
jgi:hypothetical protein